MCGAIRLQRGEKKKDRTKKKNTKVTVHGFLSQNITSQARASIQCVSKRPFPAACFVSSSCHRRLMARSLIVSNESWDSNSGFGTGSRPRHRAPGPVQNRLRAPAVSTCRDLRVLRSTPPPNFPDSFSAFLSFTFYLLFDSIFFCWCFSFFYQFFYLSFFYFFLSCFLSFCFSFFLSFFLSSQILKLFCYTYLCFMNPYIAYFLYLCI